MKNKVLELITNRYNSFEALVNIQSSDTNNKITTAALDMYADGYRTADFVLYNVDTAITTIIADIAILEEDGTKVIVEITKAQAVFTVGSNYTYEINIKKATGLKTRQVINSTALVKEVLKTY